ncbi:MAG: TonB-dependent receptor [Burkholderiales bacterium]|nr:TonB-dependent receptor [Burkholderiales bacterium]
MAQTQLDPVTITGTREPQPLSRSIADVVVINATTIRNTSADSVGDLLRREAGVQIVRNGGPGQSSGYFLRGASSSGTVVLIDGVRVGSATLGQAEFESLSLSQIDHIEVLRGPASSLYGADAVGGVIQIFTKRGDGPLSLTGHGPYGSYNSYLGTLGISGGQSGFDYAVSGGREGSDGKSALRPNDQFGNYNPDDDGYKRTFGNLKLGYTPAAGHRIGLNVVASKLNAQYDSSEFVPPDFAQDASPDFRNHLKTSVVSLDYRGKMSDLWTTTLQASKGIDDLESGGTVTDRFKTERQQATWQNALSFGPDHQVVLAYEYLREKADVSVFPEKQSRNNNALIAGYSGVFGPAGLQASLRHDDNSVYGNNTTGSVGASYQVTPSFKVRALYGTTFRAPTFNDLYYPGFGVASIKPEKGKGIELGLAWQSGDTTAGATVYRNKVKDLIGYQSDSTQCPVNPDDPFYYAFGCAANTSRALLKGATLTLGQHWNGLSLRAIVDFLDATDSDTGVRLARRAAHQETVTADYGFGAWTVGGSVVSVGSRPDGGVVLGGYGVVDLRSTWRFAPQWRVEANLTNALDHRVEPARDYRGLGRQAWIGIRYDGNGR